MQLKSSFLSIFLLTFLAAAIYGAPSSKEAIHGGSIAGIGEFPYMVSLRRDAVHDCGGALIGPRHVLTAYHCVSPGRVGVLTAVVGTNSLTRGGSVYEVEEVREYPPFDGVKKEMYDHDIAVVVLKRKVTLSRLVSAVPLPSSRPPSAGAKVQFTGWGDDPSQRNTEYLQKLRVSTVEQSDCRASYQEYGYLVMNQTICTLRDVGYGACFGDSGGPLVYKGAIIGVLSVGFDQCAIGIPDLFESVYYYIDFIKDVIEEFK